MCQRRHTSSRLEPRPNIRTSIDPDLSGRSKEAQPDVEFDRSGNLLSRDRHRADGTSQPDVESAEPEKSQKRAR